MKLGFRRNNALLLMRISFNYKLCTGHWDINTENQRAKISIAVANSIKANCTDHIVDAPAPLEGISGKNGMRYLG